MADPSAEGASALALLAPYAEAKRSGTPQQEIKDTSVSVAQQFGERIADGPTTVTDLTKVGATSSQLIPVTEQAYLVARRSNDELTLVAPRTGVPMLEFPIIAVNKDSFDMFGGARDDRSARAGRALSRWFTSNEGKAAVAALDFRTSDSVATQAGMGLGAAEQLPKVAQKTTDEALRSWRVLTIPSSLLAVIDVSGSMATPIGGSTRIQLAVDAAETALDVFPSHARIGWWAFSIDQGGKGTDSAR